MRIAVIDLGTNTCNLLIADTDSKGIKIIHQSKQLVKLGDDKIKENEISPEAIKRTVSALRMQKEIALGLHADKIRVIATSAVRSAANKVQFLEEAGSDSELLIQVVSGDREAELIFRGVLLAFGTLAEPSVILDIGGGSNEFIVGHHNNILWKESQPAGMARIINYFSLSDPVNKSEIIHLQHYFLSAHREAFNHCKAQNVKTLIGCSGAFDTIADLIDQTEPGEKQRKAQVIPISDFERIYQNLINSTHEERRKMKGMDQVRVDLIVPAVILIRQLISETNISRIVQTDYALREGVLYEITAAISPEASHQQ